MSKTVMKPPKKFELLILRTMIFIGVLSITQFFYFFLQPEYRGAVILYILLCVVLFYGALKNLYLWYHYFSLSVPHMPQLDDKPTVDILTTYFPGEPYEMTLGTLEAIQKITYPHTTYLCDEANDPYLIEQCIKLGVIHVTRNHRTDAKAGNINNALKSATGEIVLILDPDHIPEPNFLNTVIPYFKDENLGYVQVVQAYYNKVHSLVARGAAEQTFHFYGPMMMSMNSYGTVNAIGANCTFRRAALDSIGGHAPGLAEDMHTSMLLHAKGWKSVYVPKIVAKGLAPLDLTSYYKQQLKWARGVFELLYAVYPKIFTQLTLRQKLHYALLPMHYMIGFVYLLSFTIPILALFTSTMPWTGNIFKFLAIIFPVFISNLCIRVFVQKWVIEKNERGFHLIGGLLQIITWWVFILGVVYTFIRKKVPYVPTSKVAEASNIVITIPNLTVAVLSIASIIYGLSTDITPFSIAMMVFAAMNSLFMVFSLYLATSATNKNEILRNNLERTIIDKLKRIKQKVIIIADYLFHFTRTMALPLVCLVFIASTYYLREFEKDQWENVEAPIVETSDYLYKGIFYPSNEDGLSDLSQIDSLANQESIKFNLVSFYIPWGDKKEQNVSNAYLNKVVERGATPFITWEPWLNNFSDKDSLVDSGQFSPQLNLIKKGYFDPYIEEFARKLKALKHPVFLRFAHEFDNPSYPWYSDDNHAGQEYIDAWRYIHNLFSKLQVDNVKWVWNPWKPDNIEQFYPGDLYVDWLGIDLLNYGKLNSDGNWVEFEELYIPYHNSFNEIADKPILLSEFGSLELGGDKIQWIKNATTQITQKYRAIKGLVFFNSKFDGNFPAKRPKPINEYLDWTLGDTNFNQLSLFKSERTQTKINQTPKAQWNAPYTALPIPKELRGVNYRKAENWYSNNYVADKRSLEADFMSMQEVGVNTIKYRHSKIYDANVLKYSEKHGLNVMFSFWVPSDLDFARDSLALKELHDDFIKTIEDHKNRKNIIGWNFANDVWQELSKRYRLEQLEEQRNAFHFWLQTLLNDVKKIDPDRWVTKDIAISQVTTILLGHMHSYNFKIDGYSVIVDNGHWLNEFITYAQKEELPYLIGAINVNDYSAYSHHLIKTPAILSNWQNRWESHAVSFDGLLDFLGNKKESYFAVKNLWKGNKSNSKLPEIEILKPAISLGGKFEAIYYALELRNGTWSYVKEEMGQNLYWSLTKKDSYGNFIALKNLGKGNHIQFSVPQDYENHELILTLVQDGISKSIKRELNTHLQP